jgi:hypothetical protein
MAEEKKSYPIMPLKNWFQLRKKFVISIPKEVSPNYLASSLNMTTASAKHNVLPYLRLTGLIDQDGKPTERAKMWRDDNQYKTVCDEIRSELYPQELLDLAPPGDFNRNIIKSWFANTGSGISQAGKQTSFYVMLCEADPTQDSTFISAPSASTKTKPPTKKPQKLSTGKTLSVEEQDLDIQPVLPLAKGATDFSIDLLHNSTSIFK